MLSSRVLSSRSLLIFLVLVLILVSFYSYAPLHQCSDVLGCLSVVGDDDLVAPTTTDTQKHREKIPDTYEDGWADDKSDIIYDPPPDDQQDDDTAESPSGNGSEPSVDNDDDSHGTTEDQEDQE